MKIKLTPRDNILCQEKGNISPNYKDSYAWNEWFQLNNQPTGMIWRYSYQQATVLINKHWTNRNELYTNKPYWREIRKDTINQPTWCGCEDTIRGFVFNQKLPT